MRRRRARDLVPDQSSEPACNRSAAARSRPNGIEKPRAPHNPITTGGPGCARRAAITAPAARRRVHVRAAEGRINFAAVLPPDSDQRPATRLMGPPVHGRNSQFRSAMRFSQVLVFRYLDPRHLDHRWTKTGSMKNCCAFVRVLIGPTWVRPLE